MAVGPGNTMDCILNIISGFDPINALDDVLNDNKSSILNMSKDVFLNR